MTEQTKFITKHSKYRLFLDQKNKASLRHDTTKGAGNAREHDVLRLLRIIVVTQITYFLFVCLHLSLVIHLDIQLLGQSMIWHSLLQ